MSLKDGSLKSECLERLQEHGVRASAYYYALQTLMSLKDGSLKSECLERLQEHGVRASAYYYASLY
jgi:hypothetical protein